MAFSADKLQSKSLRQQVADQIRAALLSGSLQPGQKVVEREFAAQFGVSLTVVREAIVQLETEGVIVKKPNASTAIVQLSDRDILDIFAVRRELERYAFVEAARRITDEECDNLQALYEKALHFASVDDGEGYVQADLSWHRAVWRVTQNKFLESALQRAIIPLFGFSLIQLVMSEDFDLMKDARAHQDLMQALANKNPQQASEAFERAVETWMDYALETAPPAELGKPGSHRAQY